MKNISGEKVTKIKEVISTKSNKIEFDKNIEVKTFKGISSHGSHRVHGSG